MRTIATIVIGIVLLGLNVALAQNDDPEGKEYDDGHGGKVYFPFGDLSFADEVVSFDEGNPHAREDRCRRAESILGPPDMTLDPTELVLTLGAGGTVIVRFVDNALIDIDGPDLFVFEIGGAVEPTSLAISQDGEEWIEIGEIAGARADVDIAEYVQPGEIFYYVRLTDLRSHTGGDTPGADIDAIGAIGTGLKISLQGSVLFDFDESTLKPEAEDELHEAVLKILEYPNARIIIEGHTDNVGSNEYNQNLSEERAMAVRDHFKSVEMLDIDIIVHGYGESRPIATNDTEVGRENNRRVEIIILPQR